MDIHFVNATALGKLHDAVEVSVVAVNAAVGHKTHQVKSRGILFAVLHCANESFIGEKVAVLNGFCDPGKLLIDHPAGADVGVADLGVAHLTVGKTDVKAGCADKGHGILTDDLIKIRLLCGGDSVAVGAFVLAETVHDAKKNGSFAHNIISFPKTAGTENSAPALKLRLFACSFNYL